MRRDGRGCEDWRVWRARGGAGWMSFICKADSQSPAPAPGNLAAWKFSGKCRHNRSGLLRNVFNHLMSETYFGLAVPGVSGVSGDPGCWCEAGDQI